MGRFSVKRSVLFMNRIYEAKCQYGNRDAERKGHAMDVLVNCISSRRELELPEYDFDKRSSGEKGM